MSDFVPKPIEGNYPTYYEKYFVLLDKDIPILEQMQADAEKIHSFINQLPVEKYDHVYAEGKWSVRQVIQHIIDTERILSTRALCIARGDMQNLPGFDEDAYNKHATLKHKPQQLIALEWLAIRQSSLSLFMGLSPSELSATGKANNNTVSVNAILYMLVAHARHHVNIIRERYLS